MRTRNSLNKNRDLAKSTKKRKKVEANEKQEQIDRWPGYTVYFRSLASTI